MNRRNFFALIAVGAGISARKAPDRLRTGSVCLRFAAKSFAGQVTYPSPPKAVIFPQELQRITQAVESIRGTRKVFECEGGQRIFPIYGDDGLFTSQVAVWLIDPKDEKHEFGFEHFYARVHRDKVVFTRASDEWCGTPWIGSAA